MPRKAEVKTVSIRKPAHLSHINSSARLTSFVSPIKDCYLWMEIIQSIEVEAERRSVG